jgi:hypothetical protein
MSNTPSPQLNAKSRGFHRICFEIYEASGLAESPITDEHARAACITQSAQTLLGLPLGGAVARYVRVVTYVLPAILAQWHLKISRDNLATLAALSAPKQLAEYRAMAATRNVLRNRDSSGQGEAYARQALELMAVGLSNEEIHQLLDFLSKTDLLTLNQIFKETQS